jgi:hypothetical protein
MSYELWIMDYGLWIMDYELKAQRHAELVEASVRIAQIPRLRCGASGGRDLHDPAQVALRATRHGATTKNKNNKNKTI